MRLVETLQAKGIHDLGVLRAVSLVPRHLFVPESVKHRAYEDAALPIGGGQTISQPWVQARYIEVLGLTGKEKRARGRDRLGLPDGAAGDAGRPGVQRRADAGADARGAEGDARSSPGQERDVSWGDGTLGWRPYAPYDAILVAAASPEIPKPLLEQLAVGGRLVIPLGDRDRQVLTLVTRRDADQYDTTTLGDVRFVPLIGEHGFRT